MNLVHRLDTSYQIEVVGHSAKMDGAMPAPYCGPSHPGSPWFHCYGDLAMASAGSYALHTAHSHVIGPDFSSPIFFW